MTRYISVADTAKIVRKELKAHFVGIKFFVRSRSYANGASIDIEWNDGPSEPSVDKVIQPFKGARFDGSIDLQTYVDSEWEGENVHFGADYISCRRNKSRIFVEAIVSQFCQRWGYSIDKIEIVGDDTSAGIASYSLPYHENSVLSELLYNTDIKDMHRAYEAAEERKQAEREEWEAGAPEREREAREKAEKYQREEAEREATRRQQEKARNEQEERRQREQATRRGSSGIYTREQALQYLGLPHVASSDQIREAFRTKVKASADGKGGYTGDMDKLVKAKEKALQK